MSWKVTLDYTSGFGSITEYAKDGKTVVGQVTVPIEGWAVGEATNDQGELTGVHEVRLVMISSTEAELKKWGAIARG